MRASKDMLKRDSTSILSERYVQVTANTWRRKTPEEFSKDNGRPPALPPSSEPREPMSRWEFVAVLLFAALAISFMGLIAEQVGLI